MRRDLRSGVFVESGVGDPETADEVSVIRSSVWTVHRQSSCLGTKLLTPRTSFVLTDILKAPGQPRPTPPPPLLTSRRTSFIFKVLSLIPHNWFVLGKTHTLGHVGVPHVRVLRSATRSVGGPGRPFPIRSDVGVKCCGFFDRRRVTSSPPSPVYPPPRTQVSSLDTVSSPFLSGETRYSRPTILCQEIL